MPPESGPFQDLRRVKNGHSLADCAALTQNSTMTKSQNTPRPKPGKPAILGVTKDGVAILKPRFKATHFTDKELREAILKAKAQLASE